MEYKDAINKIKTGLTNTKDLKYERECADFDNIFVDFISVYNFKEIYPCVNIFIEDTEIMQIRYGLFKLQLTIAGLTLNDFFIKLKHIENINIEVQKINIFLIYNII
jgi:hypothetical protein